MMPIGFPDKFVRYQGKRLAVHNRGDAPEVEFQTFFDDTKWSLWWLPEVNNMCRVRALGSKARGEKMGAAAGLCGGLNLSFYIDPMSPTDSEVGLEDARKGEKVDKVNFIAVTSPAYEGAFRFEAAYRKGYYLIFLPPTHLRVAPFGDDDDAGIADFALVDFGIMFRFIEMEEVLQPAVSAYKGWVALAELRRDPNILLYFSNILQKPVWDSEDFITYFEGHWETWEYCKETHSVRLRPPEEKLAQLLTSARDVGSVSSIIAGAKEELGRLPLPAAAKALVVLATALTDSDSLDVSKTINRITAQKKILSSIASILSNAFDNGSSNLLLTDLLDICDLTTAVGGACPAADLLQIRQAAQVAAAEIAFKQLATAKGKLTASILARVLRLPGASAVDAALASMCQAMIAEVGMDSALDMVKHAGTALCTEVANTFATSALLMLDSRQPEPSADEQIEVLKILGEAGAAMEDVASRLQALAPASGALALACAVLAIGERGFSSESLTHATHALAAKVELSCLGPPKLLELAVASTKSASLAPAMGAVAQIAAGAAGSWQTSDLVRLLLAIAKAKGALNPANKAELLQRAAVALTPELGGLPAADLVKLVFAIAGDGCSQLLVAAAEEAVERRISSFPSAQLLILTQGLVQGLGGGHSLVRRLAEFWTESLKETGVGADSDDEITKRRRELEQRMRLSADHLVQLARVTAPVVSNRPLVEALGSQILARVRELSEAGRKSLETQLTVESGLGQYSRRERLRRAALSSGRSHSRSRSRSRSFRRRRSQSRSRSREQVRRRRSRSRSRGRDGRR